VNLLELSAWEVRHAAREACPPLTLRWLVAMLAILAEAAAVVWLCLRVPRTAMRVPPGFLFGFASFNLMLCTGVAAHGLAGVIESGGSLTLHRLSPLPRAVALHLPLLPPVAAAAVPMTLLALPLVLWEGRTLPLLAVITALACACLLGWAASLAVWLGAGLARRLGRERAARLLRVLSGWLSLGAVLGMGVLLRMRGPAEGLAAVLAVSALFLPFAWRGATRALLEVLQLSEASSGAREPRWGSAGWASTLWRSMALPFAITALIGGAMVLWRPGAALITIVILGLGATAGAIETLLGPELARPERLAAAPEGARYRRRLVFGVGGASAACGAILAAPLLIGRWRSAALVGAAMIAFPCTYFVPSRPARAGVQLALIILACSGALARMKGLR
jgi:hypothetical protein